MPLSRLMSTPAHSLPIRTPFPLQDNIILKSFQALCDVLWVQPGVVEWTCSESTSTANLSQPVDGFALHGEIPNCVAQACNLDNLAVTSEFG